MIESDLLKSNRAYGQWVSFSRPGKRVGQYPHLLAILLELQVSDQ